MTQQRLTGSAVDLAGNRTAQDVFVDVTAPLTTAWPNEPAGLAVLNDWGFDQVPPSGPVDQQIVGSPGPWHLVFNGATGGGATRVNDPGAPGSPPNVYQILYPAGFQAGAAPATWYVGYSGPATRFYHGFWWKTSPIWSDGPGNTNKLYYPRMGTGAFFLNFAPIAGLHELQIWLYPGGPRLLSPNVKHMDVTKGVWHQVEIYNDIPGHICQWWLDGVLIGSYSDVVYAAPFTVFKFSPTWGGVGATVPQDQSHYFDHIHISGA